MLFDEAQPCSTVSQSDQLNTKPKRELLLYVCPTYQALSLLKRPLFPMLMKQPRATTKAVAFGASLC
jgi:hypothetical protein